MILFSWRLLTGYWSDSEIWSIQVGKHCHGQTAHDLSCWSKPLFHVLTRVVTSPFTTLESSLIVARSVVFFCWLFCIILYLQSGKNRVLLLTFLSSSIFLLDAAYFRSDFLALPFILLNAHWVSKKPNKDLDYKNWFLLFTTIVVGIMITPKSILGFMCLLPFYWVRSKKVAATFLAICFVVAALMAINSPELIKYAWGMTNTSTFGFSLWSKARFDFLARALVENPHFVLAGLWIALTGLRPAEAITARISVGLLVMVLILFPEKLPFWISCHVFLIVFVSQLSPRPPDSPTSILRTKILQTIFICLSLMLLTRSLWISKYMTSKEQKIVAEALKNVSSSFPYLRAYDTTGLLPWNEPELPYLGPAENQAQLLLAQENIRNGIYDVIIMTNRISNIRNILINELLENYCPLSEDLWVRADPNPEANRFKSHRNSLTFVTPCPARLDEQLYTAFGTFNIPDLTNRSLSKLFKFEPSLGSRWQPVIRP